MHDKEKPNEQLWSFESVFQSLYKRLCHFAYQLLADKSLVEDLVQDAFVELWRKQDQIDRHPIAVKNFLYTTVKNSCFKKYRHLQVVQKYNREHSKEQIEDATYLQALIRAEVLHEVRHAIDTLPKMCRQVFRMGYFEGLNNAEIAQELGLSIHTVKSQKQRGLRLLKGKLDPEIYLLIAVVFKIL